MYLETFREPPDTTPCAYTQLTSSRTGPTAKTSPTASPTPQQPSARGATKPSNTTTTPQPVSLNRLAISPSSSGDPPQTSAVRLSTADIRPATRRTRSVALRAGSSSASTGLLGMWSAEIRRFSCSMFSLLRCAGTRRFRLRAMPLRLRLRPPGRLRRVGGSGWMRAVVWGGGCLGFVGVLYTC